ncbi:LamG domain-containing protein [Gracilibacillus oryzae]|uniref:LamG domain-containing protein n=1 Tax=Gracilibacillus oryzae TaxID=1672701 RepID=A0A7C8GQQ4_9BACI|nr:LamG-like jellyroll fold domain-containing protein [Gracilibacillus oryzae]KAB8126894.1 LamG domain-containing protein [Gracilibacillus oryzae]
MKNMQIGDNYLNFDGDGDYIETDPYGELNEVTFEIECFVNDFNAHSAPIGNFNHSLNKGLNIVPYQATRLQIYHGDGVLEYSGTNSMTYIYTDVPKKKWFHLAISYKNNTITIFKNGEVIEVLNKGVDLSNLPVIMGKWASSYGSYFFNGYLTNTRMWDVARTKQEIQETMWKRLSGSETNLIGNWLMNEGAGEVINDNTTNHKTGTLHGPTWKTSQLDEILIWGGNKYRKVRGFIVNSAGELVEFYRPVTNHTNFTTHSGMALHATQTLTKSEVNTGSTVLSVANAAGFFIGQEITINDGTNTEQVAVTAINGNDLTITPLQNAYKRNAIVGRSIAEVNDKLTFRSRITYSVSIN